MHPQRVAIRFPGTHEGFAQGFERFCKALDTEALAGTPRFNTELIFEEVVANIVNHGALDGRAPSVAVTLETDAESIVLTFEDDGIAFDPCSYRPPAPAQLLDEARIGGFGLVLVRHAAGSLDYVRTAAGQNRVTIKLSRSETGH